MCRRVVQKGEQVEWKPGYPGVGCESCYLWGNLRRCITCREKKEISEFLGRVCKKCYGRNDALCPGCYGLLVVSKVNNKGWWWCNECEREIRI